MLAVPPVGPTPDLPICLLSRSPADLFEKHIQVWEALLCEVQRLGTKDHLTPSWESHSVLNSLSSHQIKSETKSQFGANPSLTLPQHLQTPPFSTESRAWASKVSSEFSIKTVSPGVYFQSLFSYGWKVIEFSMWGHLNFTLRKGKKLSQTKIWSMLRG